jgi:hypothetical protein
VVEIFEVDHSLEVPVIIGSLGTGEGTQMPLPVDHLLGQNSLVEQLAKGECAVHDVSLDRSADAGGALTEVLVFSETVAVVAEILLPVDGGIAISGEFVHANNYV